MSATIPVDWDIILNRADRCDWRQLPNGLYRCKRCGITSRTPSDVTAPCSHLAAKIRADRSQPIGGYRHGE